MKANQAQEDYWTSPAGLKWIQHEHALDTAMSGMLDMMLDAADLARGDRVLDVGCGTGASTMGAARRVPDGVAVGVDISKPLLDRASGRAQEAGITNASFVLADAQTHAFAKPRFDVLVSRLGMSFFSDSGRALSNLADALEGDGRMAFVCWAETDRNPWFSLPKQAAEARLGVMAAGDPKAPGPTAFEDIAHVTNMMSRVGLSRVNGRPVAVMLTPPGGARGAARAASRVGPAARILQAYEGTPEDAEAIEFAVCRAFRRYDRRGEVRVPAVVNLFTALR